MQGPRLPRDERGIALVLSMIAMLAPVAQLAIGT